MDAFQFWMLNLKWISETRLKPGMFQIEVFFLGSFLDDFVFF